MNQKYIITGAPGTGKSSIINELKKRTFNCIDEHARQVISKKRYTQSEIIACENIIANMRTQEYLTSPKECVCFFDRSVLDCVAYLKINNLDPDPEIHENIKICNFNTTVFYTPIWEEIYKTDNERKENIKQAREIEVSILKTYRLYGYKLVQIPKTTIIARADFIISKI
tara:strand:+ start:21160 stop:21669 length:510 start_codon:yes stop_codon:yes gene_type:complete